MYSLSGCLFIVEPITASIPGTSGPGPYWLKAHVTIRRKCLISEDWEGGRGGEGSIMCQNVTIVFMHACMLLANVITGHSIPAMQWRAGIDLNIELGIRDFASTRFDRRLCCTAVTAIVLKLGASGGESWRQPSQ